MTVTANINTYRQVGTLTAPGVTSPDGDGGYVQTFVALSPEQWRFSVENASVRASERLFAANVIAQATYILRGRFHPGITTKTRVAWVDRAGASHSADVLDVNDPEGAGVELVVLVSEVVE